MLQTSPLARQAHPGSPCIPDTSVSTRRVFVPCPCSPMAIAAPARYDPLSLRPQGVQRRTWPRIHDDIPCRFLRRGASVLPWASTGTRVVGIVVKPTSAAHRELLENTLRAPLDEPLSGEALEGARSASWQDVPCGQLPPSGATTSCPRVCARSRLRAGRLTACGAHQHAALRMARCVERANDVLCAGRCGRNTLCSILMGPRHRANFRRRVRSVLGGHTTSLEHAPIYTILQQFFQQTRRPARSAHTAAAAKENGARPVSCWKRPSPSVAVRARPWLVALRRRLIRPSCLGIHIHRKSATTQAPTSNRRQCRRSCLGSTLQRGAPIADRSPSFATAAQRSLTVNRPSSRELPFALQRNLSTTRRGFPIARTEATVASSRFGTRGEQALMSPSHHRCSREL